MGNESGLRHKEREPFRQVQSRNAKNAALEENLTGLAKSKLYQVCIRSVSEFEMGIKNIREGAPCFLFPKKRRQELISCRRNFFSSSLF
ncbi:MAG: hypothetical protein ACOX8S_05910 [Christensenellales bacterium]|jgi:hypothetical protein